MRIFCGCQKFTCFFIIVPTRMNTAFKHFLYFFFEKNKIFHFIFVTFAYKSYALIALLFKYRSPFAPCYPLSCLKGVFVFFSYGKCKNTVFSRPELTSTSRKFLFKHNNPLTHWFSRKSHKAITKALLNHNSE